MASLVLNSIRSALNDVENVQRNAAEIRNDTQINATNKRKLKHLELFVLCVRKLGHDAQMRFYDGRVRTLSSLIQRIHRALPRFTPPYNSEILKKFECTIDNFKEEIGGWYTTLLVSLPQPTFDEVTDIIHSLLEHLNGLRFHDEFFCSRPSIQPIEDLIEKIRFLRNFIRFATLRSIESPQLLAHIHAVAVDAAHTSFMYIFQDYDEEEEYYVEPNFPVLLQMIEMVDPQVDETFTQALTSSKLSTHLLPLIPDEDRDPSVIMKDFIDSLLWNLWERLHTDTPIVISTNVEELLLVHEGLRLLRRMLKEQPNKFDKRSGELTRVVICDAGILIFSLYHRDMEIVVPASGLLQRINRIRITQIVNGKDFSIPDLLQRISRIRNRVEKVSTTPNPVPFQNRAPVADEIVGFGDDITSIIEGLTSGSKQLKMVAIVGMPGIGKTTLATKVFHHPSVTHHFHVRLWCSVSQFFHKKNLLLELSSLFDPDTNRNIEKSEQDLSEELRKHLKGMRYLIFLDDVWDIEAWDSLKASFPDDSNGSRILVTS